MAVPHLLAAPTRRRARSPGSLRRTGAVYLGLVAAPIAVAVAVLNGVGGSDAESAESAVSAPAAPATADVMREVLLAATVVVAAAGLLGITMRALGQSPVLGEMLGGIVLGPSALGVLAPGIEHELFPAEVLPEIGVLAQVGVVFFMFLVGLEIPLTMLRRVGRAAVPIGHAAIAVPFLLGILLALWLRGPYQPAGVADLPFVLFVALSVSVTAFPVLARILSDRELVGTRIGTAGLTAAGIGDVTAWCLLTLVVAVTRNTSSFAFLTTVLQVLLFGGVLWFAVRPALAWLLREVENRWSTVGVGAFVGSFVLACAYATEAIGVHAIFGAFLAGLVVPRSSRSIATFSMRIEGIVLWILMPLFFATIGLQTRLQDVFAGNGGIVVAAVLVVAVAGKVLGTAGAALLAGEDVRSAFGLGAMMNCRGLTELVMLDLGLSLGVISQRLFSVLVLMTIVTTMMTDPLLRMLSIGVDAGKQPTRQRPISAVELGTLS